jgi:poly(3-hydroxybutyrate) depolymerase
MKKARKYNPLKMSFAFLSLFLFVSTALGQVKVNFTLNTTDAYGMPLVESRYYWVYRPSGLSRATPVPMLLVMEYGANGTPTGEFNAKAVQAGFVVVSCSFSGNSTGTPGKVWNNDNPRITGWEDYDYTTEVINRVKASDNCNDVFISGLSKGGHQAWAYACERPWMIKAAGPIDEFMGLTSNLPQAPVPIIAFQGTLDSNVPYTMMKDSVDAFRAVNGLLNATPVTTYESSPLLPGNVTQATWRSGTDDMQVAFVTIIAGTHTIPATGSQTGYNSPDALWAFFSQFLTSSQAAPKIVSQPVNNVQVSGQPASFRVAATGNAPLRYQWKKNGVAIPNATANFYTTSPTSTTDNGATFSCTMSNGSGSLTSIPATLTVNTEPAGPMITAHPVDQIVIAGQPVAFSAAATGTGTLSYQWQKNGINILGATTASYTIPAPIVPDCGAAFRVVVTDAAGSTTSRRATLTVNPAVGAPVMITNIARARVLTGQTATFSVNAKRGPTSFQWQKGTFTGNMADIPGATNATYTTPTTTLADHLTLFRCVVSNPAGNATSASEMLFVTSATKAPTDITSPIAVEAQVGTPFRYTLTSSGGTAPVSYSANPLPDGLSVDSLTGVISGTPTATGTTRVALGVSNSAGSGPTRTLVLTVAVTPPAPTRL